MTKSELERSLRTFDPSATSLRAEELTGESNQHFSPLLADL